MPPFSLRDPGEDGFMRRAKIDNMLPGKDTGPFWGPGERSGWIDTRNLQENRGAHPVGLFPRSKTRKYGTTIQKMLDLPGFWAEIITY